MAEEKVLKDEELEEVTGGYLRIPVNDTVRAYVYCDVECGNTIDIQSIIKLLRMRGMPETVGTIKSEIFELLRNHSGKLRLYWSTGMSEVGYEFI